MCLTSFLFPFILFLSNKKWRNGDEQRIPIHPRVNVFD
nr:MAG TPA: hypothetical protein [Bacteriophage sp.]